MNKENLANGLISGSVTTGATSFPLKTGYGATMPAVPFKLTLTPFGQLSTKGNSEIVLVTARTGDNLDTVVRAQDGTTAKSFSDGDIASNGVYVSDILGVGSFVPKETPTGLVNSSNTAFTTAAPYVGGSLQAWVNGLPQFDYITEVNPGAGTFSFQDAPDTGDQVRVTYQQLVTTFGNADTVDGRHANATPTANNIPVLDSNARLPLAAVPAVNRQDGTTNTVVASPRIQQGFKSIQGSGGVNSSVAVTFPVPFASAPLVSVTMNGYKVTSAPANVNDVTEASWTVGAKDITATGFTMYYSQASGSLATNIFIGASWLAVGAS